jgi:L-alanine-DL-glutamate epimerase-like enolase superfamily enzyme
VPATTNLRPTDIRITAITSQVDCLSFRVPIKFGGRVMRDVLQLHVTAEVETRAGRRATGFGSMPLGNVWAWPIGSVSADDSRIAMAALAERLVADAANFHEYAHPLFITKQLAASHAALAAEVIAELGLSEPMPVLAQMVVASPIEAALHDAFGQALGANSYNLLGQEFVAADLAHFLSQDFAGEYLDRYTHRNPQPRMPLYHLIGALDPLTDADLPQRVNDGLPETLPEWINHDELTHLKIKLNGDDIAWDVDRVVSVECVAAETQHQRGCINWQYSLDFNERCESVEYVLEFLKRLEAQSPLGFQRVQYLEQPTQRNLQARPDLKMHAAAKIKPIVIDESLVDLESLLLARELGYSGVALKTCKGHTEALLMGAAAQKFGLFLCVQDLTCPGASFLHSASLAARIPTVAAIEGNARQYCPAGNIGWADRYPGMFEIKQGTVETGLLTGPGLGF